MAEILVIDDDRQMRRLLARILKGAGHTIYEAENGRVGMELFRQQRPPLVISDILMPDTEGIETILSLRRDNPDLRIIAISGGSDPLYLDMATKLGASGSLQKPFSPDELLRLLDALLQAAD
jgi:DNA-binding NtrC family response regulator